MGCINQAARIANPPPEGGGTLSCREIMENCDSAAEFAYKMGNANALVKAFELKAKLAGLLIEKHEVLTISLKDALDLAKQRALEREKPNSSVTILPSAEPETGGVPGGGASEQSQ